MKQWAAVAVVVLLLVGLTWFLFAGARPLPQKRAGRVARLARFGARLAASRLGAAVRRLFARGAARARISEAQRKAEAERLAAELGQMKGLVMKVGPLLSFIVGDGVSSEYRTALSSLQSTGPAVDFALLRDTVERELGKPLERAFAHFDVVPFASASIGQVHRARLPSGEAVAVKVQYPGVADAIRSDMAQAEFLYSMMGKSYPALDVKGFVGELRDRFFEELDYGHEARSQRAFADLFANHPYIRIPKVFDTHSTARVLTTEFIEGRKLSDVLAQDDEKARSRYGEVLYRFFFGTIGRFRAFHGDPHPGNYIFDAEGRIAFLDFGCVKLLDADVLRKWRALDKAHIEGDVAGFAEQLTALGFGDTKAEEVQLWFELFAGIYEPLREDRSFTFTKEYLSRWVKESFNPKEPYASLAKKVNRPAHFVFAQRIQLGTYALLTELGATGNYHRIHRELMFGEAPFGELGAAEATYREGWLRERHLTGGDLFLGPGGVEGSSTTSSKEPAAQASEASPSVGG